jgi:hypothetical protein
MAFSHFAVRGEKLTLEMGRGGQSTRIRLHKNRPGDLQLVFKIKVQPYLSVDVFMSGLFNIPIITY